MSTMTSPGRDGPCSPEESALREQALASLRRKRKLWDDLIAYAAVNGVLWLVWALTGRSGDGTMPWPAWVSAIWGFLLLLDVLEALGPWPPKGPITEADVDREVARRRGR